MIDPAWRTDACADPNDPSAVLDPCDPEPAARESLRAWLRIQAGFALSPQHAVKALRAGASPAGLAASAGSGRRNVDAAIAELGRCGARVLPWTSPLYPPRLRRLMDAPPVLLVQGDPRVLSGRAVGIVGARAATGGGCRTAHRFAEALAREGVSVVSGLARGIDGAAHAGALAGGGTTVAVQARGPDRVYPAEHRGLAREIAAAGAVITELPPGTPPRAVFFPLRNRLISGLVELVLVVEARARSGSLVTARHALDQGIDVMAVPGAIDAPTSEGPNCLLRDGAAPALEAADVLAALGIDRAPAPLGKREGTALSRDATRVLRELRREPSTREQLGERLGVAVPELALALAELEIAGEVVEERDGRLRPQR